MQFILNSRNHGPQVFTATERDGLAYVRLNGQQICDGGRYRGPTLMCMGNQESLEKAARKWWRQYNRRPIA